MARTILSPVSAPGPYDTGGASLPLTAGDVSNGNRFLATGRELLIAFNSGASPSALVTVRSKAAPQTGRTGDASYAIPSGEYRIFQLFPTDGWMQDDGYIYVDVANAALKLAVVKLP